MTTTGPTRLRGTRRDDATATRPLVARDRILATASRLFYSTGIRAVGVDRVIADSAVARMTFFRHFPTKNDLVVAFLEERAVAARDELSQMRAEGPHWPRAILTAVAAGVTSVPATEGFRGCEFINTAAEFCESSHRVRQVVHQHRAWIRDLMTEALTELDHPTPDTTAELLLMLRTGAIVAASLEGFRDTDGAFQRVWWELIGQPA